MHKKIYTRKFKFPFQWESYQKKELEKREISIWFNFTFRDGIWFTVRVPNKSFNNRNIFKALIAALESESVGMQKYDRLKEEVRELTWWKII